MKQATVLIVEDNNNNRRLYRRILEKEYHVFEATNGQEALSAPFVDLVVLDYNLPDMTGLELASYFKGIDTPFIFLTADGTEETFQTLKKAGGYGYLVKPIVNETLPRTVATALGRAKDVSNLLTATEKAKRKNFVFAAAGLIQDNGTGFESLQSAIKYIEDRAQRERTTPYDLSNQIIKAHDFFRTFHPSN